MADPQKEKKEHPDNPGKQASEEAHRRNQERKDARPDRGTPPEGTEPPAEGTGSE